MREPARPWYEGAFEREYLDLYAHRDDEDAARALVFLEREGTVRCGDLILDLCCGNGRHSAALCQRGHRVVGFDLSADLLRDFQRRVACPMPPVRGDMRRLSFRGGIFDVALSLFTSFGYFEHDEENWQVIREVARALRSGGRLAFDFLNAPQVERTLTPTSERRLDAERHVVERRRIAHGRVIKTVDLHRGDTVARTWEESVRLFTRDEIEAALRGEKFGEIKAFGDFDGSPHTASSPRLILTATRA